MRNMPHPQILSCGHWPIPPHKIYSTGQCAESNFFCNSIKGRHLRRKLPQHVCCMKFMRLMLRGLRINICISNPMLWQHRHLNLWSPDGRAAVVSRRHRLAQGEEEEGERLHRPQVCLEGTVGGHHISWHLPLRLWPWLMCFFSVMKRWRMTRSVWTELWGTTWGWEFKKIHKNFNWTSIEGKARGHCGDPELPRREVWQEGPCLAHWRQCGGSHRWNYSPWEISGS